MMAWILIVSFVLHGLSLFFILILYTRLSHLKEMEQKQSMVMKEIEEVVSSYLVEMKEQNDEFIQRFQEIKQSQPPKPKVEKISEHERLAFEDVNAPTDQDFRHLLTAQIEENHSNAYQGQLFNQDTENEEKDTISLEQSNMEELTPEQIKKMAVSLQKKGLTTEEIAKYLHRGKTEIELLLVFSKNR
jgi:Spy/CpxP family protein refolding chaperone